MESCESFFSEEYCSSESRLSEAGCGETAVPVPEGKKNFAPSKTHSSMKIFLHIWGLEFQKGHSLDLSNRTPASSGSL